MPAIAARTLHRVASHGRKLTFPNPAEETPIFVIKQFSKRGRFSSPTVNFN
jgi:hypothetical protein